MSYPNLDRCSCGSPKRDILKQASLRLENNQNNYLKTPVLHKNTSIPNGGSKAAPIGLKSTDKGKDRKIPQEKSKNASKHSRRKSDASVYTFTSGNVPGNKTNFNEERMKIEIEKKFKIGNEEIKESEKIVKEEKKDSLCEKLDAACVDGLIKKVKESANDTSESSNVFSNDEKLNTNKIKPGMNDSNKNSNTACIRPIQQLPKDTNNNFSHMNGNLKNKNIKHVDGSKHKSNSNTSANEVKTNDAIKNDINNANTIASLPVTSSDNQNNNSSQEYTSLSYDVNYVKVSPPRLTRRSKKSEESCPENVSNPSNFKTKRNSQQSKRLFKAPAKTPSDGDVDGIFPNFDKNGRNEKDLATMSKEKDEKQVLEVTFTVLVENGSVKSMNPNVKEIGAKNDKFEDKKLQFDSNSRKFVVDSINEALKKSIKSQKGHEEPAKEDYVDGPMTSKTDDKPTNGTIKKFQSFDLEKRRAPEGQQSPSLTENLKELKPDERIMCYQSLDRKQSVVQLSNGAMDTSYEVKLGKEKYQTLANLGTLRKNNKVSKTNITTTALIHAPFDADAHKNSQNPLYHGRFVSNLCEYGDGGNENQFIEKEIKYSFWKRNKFSISNIAVEDEVTHMNWDDLMREAKSLGIPLRRPHQCVHETDEKNRSKNFSFSSRLLNTLSSNWMNWRSDNQMTRSICGGEFSRPNHNDLYADNNYRSFCEGKKESPIKEKLSFFNFFFGKNKTTKPFDADCPMCKRQPESEHYQYKMLPQSAQASPKHHANPPGFMKVIKRSASTHRPRPSHGEYFTRESCPECPPCTCLTDQPTNLKASRFSLSPATKCYKKCIKKVCNLSDYYHDHRANKSLHNFNIVDAEYRCFQSRKQQHLQKQQQQYPHLHQRQISYTPAFLVPCQQYHKTGNSNLKYPFQKGSYEERNSGVIGENGDGADFSEEKGDDEDIDDVFLDEVDNNNNFMNNKLQKITRNNSLSSKYNTFRSSRTTEKSFIKDELNALSNQRSVPDKEIIEETTSKLESRNGFSKANNFKSYVGKNRMNDITRNTNKDNVNDVNENNKNKNYSLGDKSTNKPCDSDNNTLTNNHNSNANKNKEDNNNIKLYKSLQLLKNKEWYWGSMNFEEAELKLANTTDGSFLVRDSSDDRYILSVSFRSLGKTHHTRIEVVGGVFSFYSQRMLSSSTSAATIDPGSSSSIIDFIEEAVKRSRAGESLYYLRGPSVGSVSGAPYNEAAPTPVQLLHPVCRKL